MIESFPRLNNFDRAVFSADPLGSVETSIQTLIGASPTFNPPSLNRQYNQLATNVTARPAIADTDQVVVTDVSGSDRFIRLYDYELDSPFPIASTQLFFDSVGLIPAISNDAQVITFYGDLPLASANALGLTPGPGIFGSANIDSSNALREIFRIAGIAGNGFLDPGEVFNDINANGMIDVGEDIGSITRFLSVRIESPKSV